MADIDRNSIGFTDELIEAPLAFAKNVAIATTSIEQLDSLLGRLTKSGKVLADAESLTKVAQQTKELTLEEQELMKIQAQIAKVQAQANDEYQDQVEVLQKLKKETKDKKTLGEQDAKTVNAQTASEERLSAALKKNQAEYAKMEGAMKRNSKEGKELLKVINQQDKALKEIRESQGKFNDSVGNYKKGLEGLDNLIGGFIANLKQVGTALGNIFTSGWALAAAAAVGIFVALKKSSEAYYKATMEGEEQLAATTAARDAWFASYEQSWLSLGKRAASFRDFIFGGVKSIGDIFKSRESIDAANKLEDRAIEAAKTEANLRKEHLRDILDDQKTEEAINNQLEIARDKEFHTASQRIEALNKIKQLASDQEKGDIELAKQDLALRQDQVAVNAELMQGDKDSIAVQEAIIALRTKSISELNPEELHFLSIKTEDYKRLFELETEQEKIQSDASAKRAARLKLEKSILDEIQKEEEERFKKSLAFFKNEDLFKTKYYKNDIDSNLTANLLKITDNKKFHEAVRKEMDKTALHVDQLRKNLGIVPDKETELSKLSTFLTSAQEIYSQFASNLGTLYNNLSNARISNIDNEIRKLEIQADREIELAGTNDAQKKAIADAAEKRREQLEQKRLREQQRAAKFNKAIAITQATINTAQGVTGALASTPPNVILAALVGVLGAVEVAAISAQPIPKYEFGTGFHPGGKAIVGDGKGAELMREGNRWSLSPSKPTVVDLAKGAEVFSHEETVRMLALSSLGGEVMVKQENSALLNEVKQLKKSNEKIVGAIYKNGMPDFTRRGTKLLQWYQDEQGNRNAVRAKIMNY